MLLMTFILHLCKPIGILKFDPHFLLHCRDNDIRLISDKVAYVIGVHMYYIVFDFFQSIVSDFFIFSPYIFFY